MPKNFVGEPVSVSLIPVLKKFLLHTVMSLFPSIYSLVSQYRKTLQAKPSVLCFKKSTVAKIFMDKRGGGGVSRFCVEIFLSHSAEKFRR